MKTLRRLSISATVSALALIVIGAVVRVSGSGLGCPDWPRCHGRWIPPMQTAALVEYSHRLAATVTGVLILALAVHAWLKHRSRRGVFWPALAALAVAGSQAWIGRLVVLGELPSALVVVHFMTAAALLGLLVAVAVNSFPFDGNGRLLRASASASTAWVFLVMGLGAWTAQRRDDELLFHMTAALFLGGVLIAGAVKARRVLPGPASGIAAALPGLWAVQVAVGLVSVSGESPPSLVVVHVLAGNLIWAGSVALLTLSFRRQHLRGPGGREERVVGAARGVARSYLLLTKPRVIELLLITTVPPMFVASRGLPSGRLVLLTLLGGFMTAGSANSINCYFDRDIDKLMTRTSGRPVPSGAVQPGRALVFGVLLGAGGFAVLAGAVNMTAALLALAAVLFYVFVYTLWLKRSTASNIVIGGAAGAVPVLVGWTAVTGTLAAAPLVMFAIVFYWTPPHFWALALRHRSEYASAGIPMLPVVRGAADTYRQIFLYSLLLIAVSLLLYPVAALGTLYLISATVLGGALVGAIRHLGRAPEDGSRAMGVFRFSITYLVLLFAAMALDAQLGSPRIAALSTASFMVAAPVFFVAQAAVLAAVLGYRSPSPPRPDAALALELVSTAIPTLAVATLFVLAWQRLLS